MIVETVSGGRALVAMTSEECAMMEGVCRRAAQDHYDPGQEREKQLVEMTAAAFKMLRVMLDVAASSPLEVGDLIEEMTSDDGETVPREFFIGGGASSANTAAMAEPAEA